MFKRKKKELERKLFVTYQYIADINEKSDNAENKVNRVTGIANQYITLRGELSEDAVKKIINALAEFASEQLKSDSIDVTILFIKELEQ